MTAYIIGRMEIHSRDWLEECFAGIPDVVNRHNGAIEVCGWPPERLEGTGKMPEAAFIVKFPDRVYATPFWNSDACQSFGAL